MITGNTSPLILDLSDVGPDEFAPSSKGRVNNADLTFRSPEIKNLREIRSLSPSACTHDNASIYEKKRIVMHCYSFGSELIVKTLLPHKCPLSLECSPKFIFA